MLTDNKKLISIIVPIYNTDKRQLERCIDSLICQDMKELEIFMINDGSNEFYKSELKRIAKKDDRIRLISKSNGGVSSARNVGIDLATGEYIMFVDSDDWIDRECCSFAYNTAVESDTEIVMWRHVKEFKLKSVDAPVYIEDKLEYDSWKEEFDPFDMRLMGMCWMKLYKRELIGDTRFNEELTNGEDVEFNFRIYEKMEKATYINRAFYHYRQNTNSAVRSFNKDMPLKYDRTFCAMSRDIKLAQNHKDRLVEAYYSFVGIAYLVLNMNYIFSSSNKESYEKKISRLVKLSNRQPYSKAIEMVDKLDIPITRRMALYFAKYHFYHGVYAIMKVKELMNR